MNNLDIEYNTERPDIQYPEYGRSVQEMIQYAKTIENPRKRQNTVEAIIQLMMQLNPIGNRNVDDYREKLWNHAFAIGNYELDVTPPPNIIIRRKDERERPQPLGYPPSATRFRHYGNGIQALIKKAIEMPDGSKKEGFVEVIGAYMKLAYKTWNREHYVSDDIVKEDLEILSDGQLSMHEGHSSLDVLAAHVKAEVKPSVKGRSGGGRGSRGGSRSSNNKQSGNNRNSGNSSNRRGRGGSNGGKKRN